MPSLKINLIVEQMFLMFFSFLFFFIFFLFVLYSFSLQYIQLLNNVKKQYNLHYFLIDLYFDGLENLFIYNFGLFCFLTCLFLAYSYYYIILVVVLFLILRYLFTTLKCVQNRDKFYLFTYLYIYNNIVFIRFHYKVNYLFFI